MSKQFMMIEQDGKIVNKPMINTIKNPLMSSILMLFVMTMIPSSIYGQFLPQLNYVNLSNIRYPDESVNMVRISPNNSYIVVVTNLGTLLTYTPLGDLVGTSKWSGNIVAIEISKKGMVVLFNSTGFYRVYIWDWSVWR